MIYVKQADAAADEMNQFLNESRVYTASSIQVLNPKNALFKYDSKTQCISLLKSRSYLANRYIVQ